jgi:hypothetical protein
VIREEGLMSQIRISFKTGNDYRVIPVSGVYGGITPQGLVHADLFIEKAEVPESMVIDVDEATGEASEVSRSPVEQGIVRELLVGLVMRPEVARAVGLWFMNQVDQMEKQMTPPQDTWKQ